MHRQLMSPFWLVVGACGLSLAWLLPNHSYPWLGFHSDAWSAVMLAAVGTFVLWNNRGTVGWFWSSMVVCIVAAIPLFQWVAGLIPIFGVAWINFAYLIGFLLAMHFGAAWEQDSPGQAIDFLLTAISIAAVISVGLQMRQFFQLENIGIYTIYSTGARHFANMAQPNQLASLLILGLLGCGWGYSRLKLSSLTAILVALLLLIGLALTESRTGWINIGILLIACVIWRQVLPSPRFLYVVVGLCFFYLMCVLTLPIIYALSNEGVTPSFRSTISDPRWTAWGMFMKAALYHPYRGFGWGQTGHAQFLMMDEKIAQGGNFLQTHNMAIDLIIWNGIPIGLIIVGLLMWWGWLMVRRMRDFSQLIRVAFLAILCTHAMLEYPLQYAYFLLPAGVVVGSLNQSVQNPRRMNKWYTGIFLMFVLTTLAVTISDYFKAEESFYSLRFELKNIPSNLSREPPDVIALTQWRDNIKFVRMEPHAHASALELDWMRNVVSTTPSAYAMYRLALMLAMNDLVDEAHLWLRRACQTAPADQCEAIKMQWKKMSDENKKYAAVLWPSE